MHPSRLVDLVMKAVSDLDEETMLQIPHFRGTRYRSKYFYAGPPYVYCIIGSIQEKHCKGVLIPLTIIHQVK